MSVSDRTSVKYREEDHRTEWQGEGSCGSLDACISLTISPVEENGKNIRENEVGVTGN